MHSLNPPPFPTIHPLISQRQAGRGQCKSGFGLFLLFLLLLLDVADGHEGDADGGDDEYEEEADSSEYHGSVDEDVALQEVLVAQAAGGQFVVAQQDDRVAPQPQVAGCRGDQDDRVVGVRGLPIAAVYDCEDDQFQRQFGECEGEDDEVEGVEGWLDGAVQGRVAEEHECAADERQCLGQEGGSAFLVDLEEFGAHAANSYIIMECGGRRTIIMSLLQRKEFRYAVGAVGVAAALFGAFKFYRFLVEPSGPPSLLSSNYDKLEEEEKEALSLLSRAKEHTPYDALIEDASRDRVVVRPVGQLEYLRDIHYKLILSLMKGNSYQGIVTISFWLDALPDVHECFCVDYNGGGVKFVKVNGKQLEAKEVRYENHAILIAKEWLVERGKNSIEIIFENLYSFIGNGLCAYFTIDEHHKYSLRQQVVYSSNGVLDVPRFMPCLNCLNECQVRLEVIHPDTFEVFSNTSKSLQRLCSVNEYQKYPFLFDLSSSSLNKSFKLNESTISSYSNLGESAATSSYSSINYYNRKKANTHFYKERLPSVHHLFVFCSSMIELQPSASSVLESELLLRYFCKASESHRLGRSINTVHKYILDVFRRLAGENIKDFVNKIDILVINDREAEGHFAPGVILLSEESLSAPNIDIRCLYLIVRALLGLLQLERGKNVITLDEVLSLNEAVYERFQEFRNYLFIKNLKFEHLRGLVGQREKREQLNHYEAYFLKYFSKELKFLLRSNPQERISFELRNLMLSFTPATRDEFWQNFLSNYNFLSPLIVEPLIKLGIRVLGIPARSRLLEQLRQCFYQSKYVLSFYSNEEISDDLPAFIREESYGLEQRLTQIKVKQKFKDFITEKYEKYLPIRSNITEAESRYIEFKKFSENRNFHHISVLKTEIKRVTYFGTKFLHPERIPIECSILGWKLLARLKLYPADEQTYALIRLFEGLE